MANELLIELLASTTLLVVYPASRQSITELTASQSIRISLTASVGD